jgi:hypothetical protein
VKHSLFILSLLLLSSFLVSCEKKEGTLYRWKNPSGDGYIWKGFGDKQTQPRYEGEVLVLSEIFTGSFIRSGLGVMIFPDGKKYVGSWKNGKKNGQGTYNNPNGSKYIGRW